MLQVIEQACIVGLLDIQDLQFLDLSNFSFCCLIRLNAFSFEFPVDFITKQTFHCDATRGFSP